MRTLKNKKSIMSLITALAILVSTFGCTVFAKTASSTKKITDKQVTSISSKAFEAFGNLFGISASGKEIDISDMPYYKLDKKFVDDKAFNSYIDKKTSINRYFSNAYRNQILQFITVVYKGDYYMEAGDPEISVHDIANSKVISKKYSGNNVSVTLQGTGDDGGKATTEISLTYEKSKWVVNSWADLNEGLGMK